MTAFNEHQKRAAEVYSEGDFKGVTTMQDVEDQGDTLFLFIMLELADSGSERIDLHEACNRMRLAAQELLEVSEAFDRLNVSG